MEAGVTPRARREYAATVRERYAQATRMTKPQILTEFCATTGYHRKYAITLLGQAAPPLRHRAPTYGAQTVTVLATIGEGGPAIRGRRSSILVHRTSRRGFS